MKIQKNKHQNLHLIAAKKHDKNLFFTNCGFAKNHYICTKKKFSNGKPN